MLSFEHQVRCWEQRCGKTGTCVQCTSCAIPFAQQIAIEGEESKRRRLEASRWEGLLIRWLPGSERTWTTPVMQQTQRTGETGTGTH